MHDDWEKHAYDTIKGSDFLADQDAVEVMAKEATERVVEMDHWGCPFSRNKDGKIVQRPFGGAGFPRTCYAADKTGHYLLVTAYEQVLKRKIRVYAEWFVTSLVTDHGAVKGLAALNILTGDFEPFSARAVILATGGAGWVYGKINKLHDQHWQRNDRSVQSRRPPQRHGVGDPNRQHCTPLAS